MKYVVIVIFFKVPREIIREIFFAWTSFVKRDIHSAALRQLLTNLLQVSDSFLHLP